MKHEHQHAFLRRALRPIQLRRVGKQTLSQYRSVIDPAVYDDLARKNTLVLGAALHGEVAGAIVVELFESHCDILGLMVKEEMRRHGVGIALVCALKEHMLSVKDARIYVQFLSDPQNEDSLTRFFTACGFSLRGIGSTNFSFSLKDLAENRTYRKLEKLRATKEIYDITELPAAIAARFRLQFGKTIPDELSPSSVPGEIIPGLCPAHVVDGEVRAYLIVTARSEQELYLAAAYAVPGAGREVVMLLRLVFGHILEALPQYQTLVFSTVNDHALRLAEHFIGADAEKVRREELQLMQWTLEQELHLHGRQQRLRSQEAVEDSDGSMAFLLPRLFALQDNMDALSYEAELSLHEMMPSLILTLDDALLRLSYSFSDENATGCLLISTWYLRLAAADEALQAATLAMNRSGNGGCAYVVDEGIIALSDSYFEFDAPISLTTLEAYLAHLRQNLALLRFFLPGTAEEREGAQGEDAGLT